MAEDPYRSVAKWYDTIFEPMNKGLRLLGVRLFRPESGMSVLDVGCGTGIHLELYKRFECELYGIDTSPSMLEIARNRLGENAHLQLGDASAMPYQDNSFDLAISMLVLHEMEHDRRNSVLREMKRILKDTGRMLLIDFHPGPVQPFQGWITKLVILISEVAAGRGHFRNYRHFMSIKGLPALVADHQMVIEKQRIVSGGAMALFLVRR